MSFLRALAGSAAAALAVAACGGIAVVDPPSAQGGGGTDPSAGGGPVVASANSTGSFVSSQSAGGSSVNGVGGSGRELTCETGCDVLFACMLEDDLCPGASPRDERFFVADCIDTCGSIPAMLTLIDPEDCPGTVQTLKGASPEFKDYCENGPPTDG